MEQNDYWLLQGIQLIKMILDQRIKNKIFFAQKQLLQTNTAAMLYTKLKA